jgi:hypothetical protein
MFFVRNTDLATVTMNSQLLSPCWAYVFRGIGVFFDTRKGSFRYKISLYIITYHVAIIVYHYVSLSISQYIMSLGDTWYNGISSFFLLLLISCAIMCHLISRSWWYKDLIPKHDIIMIYYDITPNSSLDLHVPDPTWYHMISHDIMSPDHSPSPHNTNFDITIYHVISCHIMNHDTSWYMTWYTNTKTQIWAQDIDDMEMIYWCYGNGVGLASWQPGFVACSAAGMGYQ